MYGGGMEVIIEDSKIIELFFQRSDDALKCVSDKYGKAIHSVSFNILKNHQDAEECVNDTYVVLWSKIPPAKPDPFFPYVCKITRNISLARYRYNNAKKRNGTTVSIEEIGDCLPDCDEGRRLDRTDLATVLGNWLDTLDERNFYIFMRRYWFMDSVTYIASELKISETAVYFRIERMKKKLERYLKERGILL